MPDRGRLRRFNFVGVTLSACIGRKGGGQWGLGKGPKSGAVDSEHEASKSGGS